MAVKILLLCLFLAFANAGRLRPRIVEGHDAKEGQFPFQVSVQWKHATIPKPRHFCGGSILNEKWVVTAGHCVRQSLDNSTFIVKAGKHNITAVEASEQVIEVEDAFVHKGFSQCNITHCIPGPYDIALLKLKESLKFNARVSPIKLTQAGIEPSGNVTTSGWGSYTKREPKFPDILQWATVKIIDLKSCNETITKLTEKEPPLLAMNLCTGPIKGSTSVCQGDSGGPLTTTLANGEKELVGVTSWGLRPCAIFPDMPSVFVKVSDFVDWIKSTIDAGS